MEKKTLRKKRLIGTVVSNKMAKSVVVSVTRRYAHPIYKKFVTAKKKFHAHDERNVCNVGDSVLIQESRPYSKTKRWRVLQVLVKAE